MGTVPLQEKELLAGLAGSRCEVGCGEDRQRGSGMLRLCCCVTSVFRGLAYPKPLLCGGEAGPERGRILPQVTQQLS